MNLWYNLWCKVLKHLLLLFCYCIYLLLACSSCNVLTFNYMQVSRVALLVNSICKQFFLTILHIYISTLKYYITDKHIASVHWFIQSIVQGKWCYIVAELPISPMCSIWRCIILNWKWYISFNFFVVFVVYREMCMTWIDCTVFIQTSTFTIFSYFHYIAIVRVRSRCLRTSSSINAADLRRVDARADHSVQSCHGRLTTAAAYVVMTILCLSICI